MNKFTLIVVIFIFLIISSILVLTFFPNAAKYTPLNIVVPKSTITPTPTSFKPTNLNKPSITKDLPIFKEIQIGQIIDKTKEVELKPINKTALPDGNIEYDLKGFDPLRNDAAITQNNKVEFIRTNTRFSDNPPLLSDYLKKYGNPEKTVNGSNYFGFNVSTYIYASSGFAYIANPSTNWVYEIQFFQPTTVDDYMNKYGQDINPNVQPDKEVFGG